MIIIISHTKNVHYFHVVFTLKKNLFRWQLNPFVIALLVIMMHLKKNEMKYLMKVEAALMTEEEEGQASDNALMLFQLSGRLSPQQTMAAKKKKNQTLLASL